MKFISLFSGIGGLDLGLERAGMTCVAQVEIDPFCQAVLSKHWPDVPKFNDVRDYHPGQQVDAVVGGFPCQDVSEAGRKAGLAGERSGLFFEAMRIVDEAKCAQVILENVQGLLSSNGGGDFTTILEELAKRGFDAEWQILPASAFGALHERKRIFVVAYRNRPAGGKQYQLETSGSERAARQAQRFLGMVAATAARDRPGARLVGEPELARLVHGTTGGMDARRRRATGNAVYPAVAEYVGSRVMAAHKGE